MTFPNTVLVTLARGADRVFRIDEHGRLELLQTSDNAANGKYDDIILDGANEKAATITTARTKARPSPKAKTNSASNVTDKRFTRLTFSRSDVQICLSSLHAQSYLHLRSSFQVSLISK
jgi:hypothetical protein